MIEDDIENVDDTNVLIDRDDKFPVDNTLKKYFDISYIRYKRWQSILYTNTFCRSIAWWINMVMTCEKKIMPKYFGVRKRIKWC